MNLEEYKIFIKENRELFFSEHKPYDFIYNQFEKMMFTKQNEEFFFKNASIILEDLRNNAWKEFQILEHKFNSKMLASLYEDKDIEHLSSKEAINWFCESFPMHIYNLNLSNTQSRRSRAGKEFEAIIELILIGANIPLDSQGNIGKKVFIDKGLGKLVDIVSPGAVEYIINKRDTVLISAKTTLRERWQEVPEEMGRTGAREMFLVTLDNNITKEVIENLNDSNIQIVVTENLKHNNYSQYNSVISFEKLLEILKETAVKWDNFNYPNDKKQEIEKNINKQIEKHSNHSFVMDYYINLLEKLNIQEEK